MRQAKLQLFVIILAALLGVQVAFAQTGKCMETTTEVNGDCSVSYLIPFFSIGGGWKTSIYANNSGATESGPVWFSWLAYRVVPVTSGTQNLIARYHDSRLLGDGEAPGFSTLLAPGNTQVVDLLGPADSLTAQANGTLMLKVTASDPKYLRGLLTPWVRVVHTLGFAATVFPTSVAAAWKGSLPVITADATQGYAIGIGNPGKVNIIVQGSLYDQNNNLVAKQSWTVSPKGAVAFGIIDAADKVIDDLGYGPGFGKAIFGNKTEFNGRIELVVVSAPGGVFAPIGFTFVGTGMSSAPLQAFAQ